MVKDNNKNNNSSNSLVFGRWPQTKSPPTFRPKQTKPKPKPFVPSPVRYALRLQWAVRTTFSLFISWELFSWRRHFFARPMLPSMAWTKSALLEQLSERWPILRSSLAPDDSRDSNPCLWPLKLTSCHLLRCHALNSIQHYLNLFVELIFSTTSSGVPHL